MDKSEPTRELTVAAIQCALGGSLAANLEALRPLVAEAAQRGAQVVLPPELFQGPYFCKEEQARHFEAAFPLVSHPAVLAMQELARQHSVTIPTSFFEREGPHFYNSLVMIGPDGELQKVYRKSHIPDGPGYEEKFYFRPGNTGFQVWSHPAAQLGVGICWDQWFPETARALMLQGAEILFFPTAIGSEPQEPSLDTCRMWQRAMQGHAVSNIVPVVAANRIGDEQGQVFYGHSFICDHRGDILAQLGAEETGVITATFNLSQLARDRANFGFFRDRRPELYGSLVDG